MSVRLVLAIVSTLLEETALVVVVLWGLPQIDIMISLAGLIVLMLAWLAFSIFIYRAGSHALRKRPIVGLPTMVYSQGKVVIPLDPDGLIKIKNELWEAKSAEGRIDTGEKTTVVEQEGLKLTVRRFVTKTKRD